MKKRKTKQRRSLSLSILLEAEEKSVLTKEQNKNIIENINETVERIADYIKNKSKISEDILDNNADKNLNNLLSQSTDRNFKSKYQQTISEFYDKLNNSIYQLNNRFFLNLLNSLQSKNSLEKGICEERDENFNNYKGLEKKILNYLKEDDDDKVGNVISFYFKLCDPETISAADKKEKIKKLYTMFSNILDKNINKRITTDDIEKVWEEYKEDPRLTTLISKFDDNDPLFSNIAPTGAGSENRLNIFLRNPKEDLKKLYLVIYNKLKGKPKQEPFVPPPVPANLRKVIGYFSPGKAAPTRVTGEPTRVTGGASDYAAKLRARLGRDPASGNAELQESLQLKKLSLKEAMEKEYD